MLAHPVTSSGLLPLGEKLTPPLKLRQLLNGDQSWWQHLEWALPLDSSGLHAFISKHGPEPEHPSSRSVKSRWRQIPVAKRQAEGLSRSSNRTSAAGCTSWVRVGLFWYLLQRHGGLTPEGPLHGNSPLLFRSFPCLQLQRRNVSIMCRTCSKRSTPQPNCMQACSKGQSYAPLAQGQITTDKQDLASLLSLAGEPREPGSLQLWYLV